LASGPVARQGVVFVEHGGDAVAVPFSAREQERQLAVDVGGGSLTVRLNGWTAEVSDDEGRLVPFAESFWFAVAAFQPDARVED
jgi:hypothetical protein